MVMAVIDTDSSTLPRDNDDMKLDILPPGHDATRIIPSAIIGVIRGLSANAMAKVTAGNATHCNKIPVITDLGAINILLNVCGLIPNATPNITNASMIFTIVIPA